MIEFSYKLRDKIEDVITTATGSAQLTTPKIVTFDRRLRDFQIAELPALVVFVRNGERVNEDINAPQGMRDYFVHIYYLDITQGDYDTADLKRANLMSRIEKALNTDFTFGGFSTTDTDGTREYVWHSEITAFNFDSSGEEGDYSFVGEMYLTVHTAT